MDQHQHDAQPPSGRRKFLRQLGMTAAATAALSGLADVVGLKLETGFNERVRVKIAPVDPVDEVVRIGPVP